MDKIITLRDLMAKDALEFCNNDFDFSKDDSVCLDVSELNDISPFGMLLVGSKLREIRHRNLDVKFTLKGSESKTYAGHMGFFKSFNADIGKNPGEANGNTNYLPITSIEIKELRKESYETDNGVVQNVIERKSRELAKVLTQRNEVVEDILTYSIREIMRNIVEHSTAEKIWFAAQCWHYKGIVEISILDEGVGIEQAISFNPNLEIKKPEDALFLAIEPGVSGKAFKINGKERRQDNGVWNNSGYGLYVTSRICQLGGNFLICSGKKALAISGSQHGVFDTDFKGTAIRLRLKISEIAKFKGNLIEEIVLSGEKKARDNSERANITASKVSRILTQTN